MDLKEKEIFQLQSKLNSLLNNKNNKNEDSNRIKIAKNINSNGSFYGKDDPLKDYKKISNNENISNNHNSIDDEVKNKINYDNTNIEILTKKNKTGNKIALIHQNSIHKLNKCNSLSKINYKKDMFSEKDEINMNLNNNNNELHNNNQYINDGNLSTIKKMKNNSTNNNKINSNEYKSNTLNHSSHNIKDNNNENIIIENINNMNNINNSINSITIEQKGNNYVKINDNKLLLIAQNKPSKSKRTFSALNNHDKNNKNNNIYQEHIIHPKEKLKLKRDTTPDKLSNINQNINNSLLKINDNPTNRKFYLIKRTPKKNGYKNSMPNIKGMNIYKNNNQDINKFQFLSNKIGNNNHLNNNYKMDNYSLLKFNEFKRISPQNKLLDDETKFNFNNTNIINNKIIQKERNINNNIIIINGEIVEQNNNKDEYPLISINKNNISLKRVSLKNEGTHEFNKIKK